MSNMQVCNYKGCYLKGIAQPKEAFFTISNGKPYAGKTCAECLPRKRASNLKSIKSGGKESYNRYQKSEKGKTKSRRNDVSEMGRKRSKRARNSVAGKATSKRLSKKFQKKCLEDPQYRVPMLLRQAYYSIIKKHGAGERFFIETVFVNREDLINHLKSFNVNIDKIGEEWELEHRIPIVAYDHRNPEEVKKCWSKSNITTSSVFGNKSKGFKIVDSECMKVESALWPKQWFGVIPTEEQKAAMRVRIMEGRGLF
jgi:ribosomal protein S17E